MVPAESSAVVTTIIPTFRRPKLLKRAIRSALNQTRSDLIVSVFDNASGDETPHVVADFMKRDSRVRYFRHPQNIGAFRNFEYGMRQVLTPYFSFLSDDDLILPNLYEAAIQALDGEPSAMFFAAATIHVELDGDFKGDALRGWHSGLHYPPEGLYALFRRHIPWTGVVFRRDVVSQFPLLEDAGTTSDRDFMIRIAARHPFVVSKAPAAVRCSNPESASNVVGLQQFWKEGLRIVENIRCDASFPSEYRAEALRLFQRELRMRIFSYGQKAALNGGPTEALEAARLLQHHFGSQGKASRLKLLVTLNRLGLSRPVRFAAKASRSLRHPPSSLLRLMEHRLYRRGCRSIVTELLQEI